MPVGFLVAALDYLHSHTAPDLILLDMLMPVLDGWQFLKELRRYGVPLPAPIVVISSTMLTRKWAADHGCAGFLPKPIATAGLLVEARRCLELTKGPG